MRIRFVAGTGWMSTAIRIGQRDGIWTHVDNVLKDGYLAARWPDGVTIKPFDYDKGEFSHELFVDIPATAKQNELWEEFLLSQRNKKYDMLAVTALALGRDWRDPNQWFCSELSTRAFEVSTYLPLLSSVDNHISPRDELLIFSSDHRTSLQIARSLSELGLKEMPLSV